MSQMIPELPEHAGTVEDLLELCFGPGRYAKTAYRLREGVEPEPGLSWLWEDDGEIQATIRYWPVLIAGKWPALMLGPLAVLPRLQGTGLGRALMRHTLDLAREMGHERVFLVGDEPYYARVGFSRAAGKGLDMPGPVDHARLLALALTEGAMDGVAGMIGKPDPSVPQTAGRRAKGVSDAA